MRDYMMNYRIQGTGLTGTINFTKATKHEAKLATTATAQFFYNNFGQELESLCLYIRNTTTSSYIAEWQPVNLEPVTEQELKLEEKAISDLDSAIEASLAEGLYKLHPKFYLNKERKANGS